MKDSVLFRNKMVAEGLPDAVIETFLHYYTTLLEGRTGLIPEADIFPIVPGELPASASLGSYRNEGTTALSTVAVLKLNGGMGTSMGLEGPKALLSVKDNLSFLDITARQILAFNKLRGAQIPLVLMNSFSTEKESCALLGRYPALATDIPLSFLQHKFPRINADTLGPVSFPADPELEWNPPGHGELYTALLVSGLLDKLLSSGINYLFVSNSDNLGATLNTDILGYFAAKNFSFLMEVTERTAMDRKGGHCARLQDGRLVLRESVQCLPAEMDLFQDISRHRYFNTNNIWINLPYVKELMGRLHGVLDLPLIVNPKPLDPRDPSSLRVLQLENAMGSAISVFENTQAVVVDRMRFIPVKKCEDLLNIRSDRYMLDSENRIQKNPDCRYSPVTITLDPAFFGILGDFEQRFPYGAPSLAGCSSLDVHGDVVFGKDIICKDAVTIQNRSGKQKIIPDGSVLSGAVVL